MTKILVPASIVLGMGFDTRTQSVALLAVDGTIETRTDGWAPDYKIDYVDSYAKLNTFYSLDASARYSGAGGGAAASVSIVRSAQLERRSVVLAVRVRAATGRKFHTTARLNEASKKELAKHGLPDFVDKFGDSYIRSITYGGEIAALLIVTSDSTEKLEALRARASGEGYGASGSVESSSLIQELTKNYRVQVTYSQTGGGAGTTGTGIITLTPENLLARMDAFIAEIKGTDALNGAVAPMEMEVWPMTKTEEWPGGDPLHAYPPEVERIAETLDMLRDKLDQIESNIANPAGMAPSTFQASHIIRDYLKATLDGGEDDLRQIIADKRATASLPLESLAQYRLRNLLRVEPALHENAGTRMDANNPDKAQLRNELIGPETFPDVSAWPKFKVREVWGYFGEDGGAYAGLHWRCAKHEVHTAQTVVWPHFGKKTEDDGIFVHASIGGSAYRSGNFCGYTPMHAIAIDWEKPDKPQLAQLPELPQEKLPPPALSMEAPSALESDRWLLSFAVDTEDLQGTACAYTIVVTETSTGSRRRTVLKPSYWMSKAGPVRVRHTYSPQESWSPVEWEVELGPLYRLA